jgi:hypothetical protein
MKRSDQRGSDGIGTFEGASKRSKHPTTTTSEQVESSTSSTLSPSPAYLYAPAAGNISTAAAVESNEQVESSTLSTMSPLARAGALSRSPTHQTAPAASNISTAAAVETYGLPLRVKRAESTTINGEIHDGATSENEGYAERQRGR